jgi:hypothetical protein
MIKGIANEASYFYFPGSGLVIRCVLIFIAVKFCTREWPQILQPKEEGSSNQTVSNAISHLKNAAYIVVMTYVFNQIFEIQTTSLSYPTLTAGIRLVCALIYY